MFPVTNWPICSGCEQIVNKKHLDTDAADGKLENLAGRRIAIWADSVALQRQRTKFHFNAMTQMGTMGLRQSPFTATDVNEQPGIAQDLKLLADFILHVPVVGMQLLQFLGEGVGIGGCKLGFAEAAGGVQYVQCPTALGYGNFFQRFDALESFADFGCRGNPSFGHDPDSGVGRDAAQIEIAANPGFAASFWRRGITLDDGGGRKSKMRYEQ